MSKIPIPMELHKRSQIGIHKAKEEMGEIKKGYKHRTKFLMAISVILPFLISGSMVLYDQEIHFNSNNTQFAASPPIERSANLPSFDKAELKKFDMGYPAITSASDYMRNATIIFTGRVTEVTQFQIRGETLTKIRVDVEETYRGSTKKGEIITFVVFGQTPRNIVVQVNHTGLFFGNTPADSQLYKKEVGGEYYMLLKVYQGTEAEKVLEQVNK